MGNDTKAVTTRNWYINKATISLRIQKKFPIPHKPAGRSVLYSILHVADFLIDGEVYTAPNKKYEPKPATKVSRKKPSLGV